MAFITLPDIIDYSPISSQIDAKFIEPFITTSQDIHIEPVLGSTLNSDLLELIDTYNVTGITGTNQTLIVSYIQPAMIWLTAFEGLHFLDKKIKNSGIVKSAGDGSTNLSIEEFADFEKKIKDNAMFYKSRLVKYLNDNVSSFPSYCYTSTNNINSIGLYLGNF